jgi:YidC/Oxa1 family membrane protein insertase
VGDFIGAIVDGLASIIKFFATIGGGYVAVGIILFTITIRLLLLPLTLKAVRSSRAMQQLQPYIKEINEKYKTKPGERLSQEKSQKKQQEIMALYSEYSVNPAAGCLPILIQIPIFFAVYASVTKSLGPTDVALNLIQNAWGSFAPGAASSIASQQSALSDLHFNFLWVPDLRKPDPTFILPVLMVVFQFMTQKMAIPKGGGADDQQRRINGIMQWMPLIFGFTALNFPTGPVVYWVTTSIFSTIQQYFITGWNSLADIPGLGFLPQKPLPKVELKKRADTGKPAKPSLMQRLMENQERLKTEVEVNSTSADAGDESKPKNTFGRKVETAPDSAKTSGTIKKPVESGPPPKSEVRATNQEEAIRQAYQNLNRRPPKKSGAAGTGGTAGSNGNSAGPRSKKK